MLIVRPARDSDFDAFSELARLSGPGFTSLPDNEELLRDRIAKSEASFVADVAEHGEESYLLMLEDTASGRIMGCAAVKAGVGLSKPFFNFKLFRIAQSSHVADRRFDMDVAVLVNEFAGSTEVGTLFVHPDFRGGGTGRMLAQSRYLLMAAGPQRFGPVIISELRGLVDDKGRSPFWDALGSKFFRMEFDEADEMSAATDNQFILDLMPKYPIYLDLLPAEARKVVGEVHADGAGAMRLLEWEGFRYDRVVDIFDGGPLVSTPQRDIRTIRESRVVTVRAGSTSGAASSVFLSSDRFPDFRVCRTRVSLGGSQATVDATALAALGLADGDPARVWIHG